MPVDMVCELALGKRVALCMHGCDATDISYISLIGSDSRTKNSKVINFGLIGKWLFGGFTGEERPVNHLERETGEDYSNLSRLFVEIADTDRVSGV